MSKTSEIDPDIQTNVEEWSNEDLINEKDGTVRDAHDMHRMGKDQLFRRNFRFYSIFSFTMVLLSTWEAILGSIAFGLGNGGTAGLIYMYIVSFFGFSFSVLSLAEMASMAPTAGGQYHWISEFAPRRAQKFLSYVLGWLCVLAWQVGVAAGSFLAATMTQGLVVLNYPDYIYHRWHGTLIAIAIVLLIFVLNTFLVRYLPWLQTFGLVLHIGGFFGFVIPVWTLGPHTTSHAVWTTFDNEGGWQTTGLSTLVGLVTPAYALLGADSAAHMSEELRNAGKSLPRAMLLTTAINGSLGLVTVITFCYTAVDVNELLKSPTGFPSIQLYYNATGSVSGTTAMVSIMICLAIFNATANMAAASRQLFAFARDHGFPFRSFFASVPQSGPIREVPLNAIIFTGIVTCLLSLINIGSTTAFNQIISLGITALISSYLVSTSCMALRRIRGQPLLDAIFTLGKAGLPINLITVAFLLLVFVMSFFPPIRNPSPSTMNWAILVYGVVVLFSLAYYAVVGRHRYNGPVAYVRKLD